MSTITVLIAVLNGVKVIGRAIGSAQEQSFRDIEILVVDDGSTDGTAEFVAELSAHDPRIRVMRLPQNRGAAAARNEGLIQTTTPWVAILDADDWMESDRLQKMLDAAEQKQADVVLDNMKICDHELGKITTRTFFGDKNHVTALTPEMLFRLDSPLRRHSVGYLQPLFRTAFLKEHKFSYDLSYRVGEDFLLLANIILAGGKTFIIPDATYVYVHMVSPTTRKKAPNSKTKNGADQLVRGSDELLATYGATMTGATRSALLKRRSHFLTLQLGREMLAAAHEKQHTKVALYLLKRPQIFVLMFLSLAKMHFARLANAVGNFDKSASIPNLDNQGKV